ncbi:TetR/AcrR family transcriptional regulator [Marinitenerispora sediminis]|uniref:TetR/AcrR family transcriptional regulator n=1 Tax=Marinitenerispora sediminis TaxID=1931232 RepID=UPI001F16639C|nr:TetR/AcrR family transcriptional regulator [Marinitenerispora sediminis]
MAAIHDAAIAEVLEVGLGRMTMEGIARRAGAAKTSLYRRWTSPHDLLLDALRDAFPQEVPSPASDDLRGDLIEALRQMVGWMGSPQARAVAAIMTERDRHPGLAEALFERVFEPRGGRFTRTVLRHYAACGAIDGALVTPVVADIGEALVIKYFTDTGVPPDDDTITAIVDQAVLPAVGAPLGR